MANHRAAAPSLRQRLNRRILLSAALVSGSMLATAGAATAQDDQTCGTIQAVCTDEVAEVNGPIAEVSDLADFSF